MKPSKSHMNVRDIPAASDTGRRNVIIRVLAAVLLAVVFIWIALAFDWGQMLSQENIVEALEQFAEIHLALSIAVYLLLIIVGGTVLALPGILFAIVAGIVFGPWLGTLLCVIGATGGAILSFLVSRYLLRDAVEPRIRKSKRLSKILYGSSVHGAKDDGSFRSVQYDPMTVPIIAGTDKDIEGRPSSAKARVSSPEKIAERRLFVTLMITRLIPLFPFNLQNFAYGVTPISFGAYCLGTFVFLIPGTAIFTFAAAGIIDEGDRIVYLCIAIALGVALTVLTFVFRKKFEDVD